MERGKANASRMPLLLVRGKVPSRPAKQLKRRTSKKRRQRLRREDRSDSN